MLALRVELRIATLLVWRLTNLAIRAVVECVNDYNVCVGITYNLVSLEKWLNTAPLKIKL